MTKNITIPTRFGSHGLGLLVVRKYEVRRLADKHFRDSHEPLAGNFRLWADVEQLLTDTNILPYLQEDILEVILQEAPNLCAPAEWHLGTQELTLWLTEEPVGWSSTISMTELWEQGIGKSQTEPFEPNRRSTALRITESCDLKAPPTWDVTIKYELKFEPENGWVAVIHTVYPGKNIGDVRGDVSKREKIVFFDWNHPGEPV